MRTFKIGLVTAFAVMSLASCGGSDGAADKGDGGEAGGAAKFALKSGEKFVDETSAKELEIVATDNKFVPKYVEVKVGTKVTFTNKGRNIHNVYAVEDDAFEPVLNDDFDRGESATRTFDAPGDYPYYCTLHATKTAGMIGGIRVVE